MNSRERQAKMQELVDLIQATLKEIKKAKERDEVFEERKRLYYIDKTVGVCIWFFKILFINFILR